MKRRLCRSLFVLLLAALAGAPALHAQVLRIQIDGAIQPIVEEYIGRTINLAARKHADAVLIELRTPGGLVDSTHGIIEKMLASPVPVIVYVSPSGARAASAGFYILEAADVAAMAPGTNTGAAHPVMITGKMDEVMKAKVENDAAAFLRSFVTKRGRNAELAETAVRESKSWTDQEALSQHLIDVVASSDQDLFRQLQGKTITRFNGDKVTLNLVGKPVENVPMTLRQDILDWLMDPNIAFIILAIGGLSLYAEFTHPGAIVPGVVGTIFILLSAFALNLLPVSWAAVTLIFAGFVLFALEAHFATHGILGIGGIAALTMGGLFLVDGPIPQMRVHIWTALGVSIPMGVITIFLTTLAIKAYRNKVVTGPQGLVGELGIARTDLMPAGKVFVHGELWDAHSTQPVEVGKAVRVLELHDMELVVEPISTTEPVARA